MNAQLDDACKSPRLPSNHFFQLIYVDSARASVVTTLPFDDKICSQIAKHRFTRAACVLVYGKPCIPPLFIVLTQGLSRLILTSSR